MSKKLPSKIIIVENGKACIRPVTKKVDDVFGRLYKPEKRPVSVEEMDEKIRQKMRAISQ